MRLRSGAGPLMMSLGEKQMLIEYSSTQLLKKESTSSQDSLTTGMTYLTKLVGRSPDSAIPLHVLTDLIGRKIDSKYFPPLVSPF